MFPLWYQELKGKNDDKFLLSSIPVNVKLSCNRPWRPIGLWDFEAPTFSREAAHIWRWGCEPYAPAALYLPGRFLILNSIRGRVDPRAIIRLAGRISQLKYLMTSLGIKHATYWLVALRFNKFRYRVPLCPLIFIRSYWLHFDQNWHRFLH
jgi:hypothetical protein